MNHRWAIVERRKNFTGLRWAHEARVVSTYKSRIAASVRAESGQTVEQFSHLSALLTMARLGVWVRLK